MLNFRQLRFALRRNARLVVVILIFSAFIYRFHIHRVFVKSGHGTTTPEYIAENLNVQYDILKNQGNCHQQITFTNNGDKEIKADNWSIFFYNVRLIEPALYPYKDGVLLKKSGMRIYHHAGCLYELQPDTDYFEPIKSKENITVEFQSSQYLVSYTDIFPNWYVYKPGFEPSIIKNTGSENLNFVSPFKHQLQWKRSPSDKYHPPSLKERYHLNADVIDLGGAANRIIPTPYKISINDNKVLIISPSTWHIKSSEEFLPEVELAAAKLGLNVDSNPSTLGSDKYILFKKEKISVFENNEDDNSHTANEAYRLNVDTSSNSVIISASTNAGAFYAIQSLLAIGEGVSDGFKVPEMTITDGPRFEYRGLHVDVARNFQSKEEIMKILTMMATYKLNKFHFHLSDDEGWRLEIPGLEELTQIGGTRCHDIPNESECLQPQLGSGPFATKPGSGFYTVKDYRDILRHANSLHIQVIPEIDMPGHARAAIKAMEQRYRKLKYKNRSSAIEYLLSDMGDNSVYESVQFFIDNAVNPCIESTYVFIRHVIKSIKEMHKDVQPLKCYHYGGDEVPRGAWSNSPACQELLQNNTSIRGLADLKRFFLHRVFKILDAEGLNAGAWEDGIMDGKKNFERVKLPFKRDIYGYAWQNVWEWRRAHVAYSLANNGYKVVLAHATHLYFDHPHEPDPQERGFYWATRFTGIRKVFGYMPDDLYGNADVNRDGHPVQRKDICDGDCTKLQKPENIAGIQACMWTETVRTESQFEYMLFPRILALAERAWHKASWESESDRKSSLLKDWTNFANTLGYQELHKLDKMGIAYRVPPPGAIVEDDTLKVNSEIPGLGIEYSTDGGETWRKARIYQKVDVNSMILLRTRSADGKRYSRILTWSPTNR